MLLSLPDPTRKAQQSHRKVRLMVSEIEMYFDVHRSKNELY